MRLQGRLFAGGLLKREAGLAPSRSPAALFFFLFCMFFDSLKDTAAGKPAAVFVSCISYFSAVSMLLP